MQLRAHCAASKRRSVGIRGPLESSDTLQVEPCRQVLLAAITPTLCALSGQKSAQAAPDASSCSFFHSVGPMALRIQGCQHMLLRLKSLSRHRLPQETRGAHVCASSCDALPCAASALASAIALCLPEATDPTEASLSQPGRDL